VETEDGFSYLPCPECGEDHDLSAHGGDDLPDGDPIRFTRRPPRIV